MSEHFLGIVGTPDINNYNKNVYSGVSTLQNLNTLNSLVPVPVATLTYPSVEGGFGGGSEFPLSKSDFPLVLYADETVYPYGAYKLVLNENLKFQFDIWGGGGWATSNAGCSGGGHTTYTANFSIDDVVGLYIAGTSFDLPAESLASGKPGGWPDGGHGGTGASYHGYGGAGSSRIGPWYSTLAAMNHSSATYYAIAGGAGGRHGYSATSGPGGGTTGGTAPEGSYFAGGGGGGTQTAGGTGGAASSYGGAGLPGSKYQGGNGVAYSTYGGGGGGGGGYYGGGAGGTVYASGGGGSGYINTSFSGYVSGSGATSQGTFHATNGGQSPAGSNSNKPYIAGASGGAGDPNHTGAIVITLV